MRDDEAWASIPIAAGAALPVFAMHRQDERDLVACQVALNGWQAFERPLPDYLFKVARSSPGLVVDVGANTGFYSLLAASASDRNRVIAFEPVPAIVEMLNDNILRNELAGRVRPIACAVSDRSGFLPLYMPTQEHGIVETSASLEAAFKTAHASADRVLVRTLDRAMLRIAPWARRLSLIKIDVEGHEAAVLAGGRWTIRRYRPIVFVEILPGSDIDALGRFIRRHRYRDVRLVAGRAPVVGDGIVYDPESWNHAFVPREKVQAFCAL